MKRHFFFLLFLCGTRCHKLPIGPDKPWLAPLAGYTNAPFRQLCFNNGAGLTFTEMASAKAIFYKDEKTKKLLITQGEQGPIRSTDFWK